MSNYIKFLYQAGLLSTITLMGANCGGSGNNTPSGKNTPSQHSSHTSTPRYNQDEPNNTLLKNNLDQEFNTSTEGKNYKRMYEETVTEKENYKRKYEKTVAIIMKLKILTTKLAAEDILILQLDLSNERDTQFKDACLKAFDKSSDQLIEQLETAKDDVAKSQKIRESFDETIKKSVKESMYKQGYTEQRYQDLIDQALKPLLKSQQKSNAG
ncbi:MULTISPECIES: hypothetical protein [unclassified Candidatus Cardinium]|uniref:hypothetical protein n=1 Tax=unclassified Candidatus Cardinium TaxID=2641185 RepID=UPI001FB55E0C|nr:MULTISPECIES: hypothetical protein [unclassified Candidatus Cardinium]